jgi:Flp pilus assembly protein TadD
VKTNRFIIAATLIGLGASGAGAQVPTVNPSGQYHGGLNVGTENVYVRASVEVDVQTPGGGAVSGATYISLIKSDGKVFATAMAVNGRAHFADVPRSRLTARVIATGFDTANKPFEIVDQHEVKVAVDLRPMMDREAAAADRGISALNPKAQKSVGKALEDLRANKFVNARADLEAAQRYAPSSAEIEYLLGVCASKASDPAQARAHWVRAIELKSDHLSALLALSQDLLHERKGPQAESYLQRALTAEPSSWRVHMLLAQADLIDGKSTEAVTEAERAIDLGHDAASSVTPVLAHALFESGERDRAIQTLHEYVKGHPSDRNAVSLLERLEKPPSGTKKLVPVSTAPTAEDANTASEADLAIPSNWMPADVDEKVPAVEGDTSCAADEIVKKAGVQLERMIGDVDRFTATEILIHESVNKFGIAGLPEKRKFDYLVSIQNSNTGKLSVSEYRNGGGSLAEFPEGLVTRGLPALVLVFHPYYATSYDMTCEGLARTSRGLAWQVHFRQSAGKPTGIQSYQLGMNGPTYQVKLKGRAWIAADSYEIVRMESDLVEPIPQIRLLANHTAIEYGPVSFLQGKTTLWLPQSAEVYFAWRGHRIHRRHMFSDYMLFGIDDQQKINAPKEAEGLKPCGPSQAGDGDCKQ